MTKTADRSRAAIGDGVLVHGHRVGEVARTGEILDVLGDPGHEHYRVRWEDGRESVFFPGSDTTVRPRTKRRRAP
jgi:Domain of unknown function (DUF1918)